MRSVVIVSPHFPPSTLAGVHRARHLAGHLHTHGWRPIIVSVDPCYYTERDDPDLARLLPEELIQLHAPAIRVDKTRPFGVTDVGLRGYRGLRATAERAALEHDASVIMITGSPFYPLLSAGYLKQHTGLPVLIDFQDPWINDVGATLPFFSKGRMAHRLACLLEPRAMAEADFVTSVSERQNERLLARYPDFDPSRLAALPIGGDPADFEKLREMQPSEIVHHLESGAINFSYVGTMLPRSVQLFDTLMASLAMLRSREPDLASRIRLNFVGTSNQVNKNAPACVMPIADAHGVADLVRETPGRVPFLQALSLLASSDGLLLIGSDEPHYTASKIYPNLMAKRPYLSLFHEASSAHAILSESKGGRSLSFTNAADLSALAPQIADILGEIARFPERFPPAEEARYAEYTAANVAKRYAEIFEVLSA